MPPTGKKRHSKEEEINSKFTVKKRNQISELLDGVFGFLSASKDEDPILRKYLNLEFNDMDKTIHNKIGH
jgi:hypothetical protein